jgi:hypothetical protein
MMGSLFAKTSSAVRKNPASDRAYIAACTVISLIATALMTDYTGKDISA